MKRDRCATQIAEGHYARKQILSASRLIAWSHRRRFEMALELTRGFAGKRILDYGCGDGTFLALLMSQDYAPAGAVGAEISNELVEDCRRRLGEIGGLSFVLTSELKRPEHTGAYDAVICMEVLEHVVNADEELDRLVSLLTQDGRLIISVPVETGPALIIKQMVRRFAGWLGVGDYPGTSSYSLGEIVAALFARSSQHVKRPIHKDPSRRAFHDHKGFNWRILRDMVAARVRLEATRCSPLTWLPPGLASQIWLIGQKR